MGGPRRLVGVKKYVQVPNRRPAKSSRTLSEPPVPAAEAISPFPPPSACARAYRHCEYHSLETVQVEPAAHVVGPL